MKRLLIEGWRGVSHSFAMVNQHQILALHRLGIFDVFHHDMPFFMPNWSAKDNSAGFGDASAKLISELPDIAATDADFVFRICAPFGPITPTKARTLTFAVTEFGLAPSLFLSPQPPLADFTRGEDLVVTPSRWVRDRLLDYGYAEHGIRVLPHGVDTAVFHPLSEAVRQQSRVNIGFGADAVVFLNVGSPTWNKGVDVLVEAFARLLPEFPTARLILKDGSHLYGLSVASTLRNLSLKHPALVTDALAAAIAVVSSNMSQAELCQLYNVCDCYVSPYRAEGFNLPVLEALACGKPVIVTSGGSTDDFCHGAAVTRIASIFNRGPLGEFENACWLDPQLGALIDCMRQAAERSPHDASFATAAVEQAQKYTWDRAATTIADLFGVLGTDLDRAGANSPLTTSTQQTSRTMHIYCDGGFGNRFNGLISGLILAKEAGLKPLVVWPRNNWCGAGFADLLTNDFDVVERELVTYVPEASNFQFFMTEDHLGMRVANKSPLELKSLEQAVAYLRSDKRDIYYHTPLIPSYLDSKVVLEQAQKIIFQPDIVRIAGSFIRENSLKTFYGIQIRKTDFGIGGADDKNLYDLVKSSSEKDFFVCSDDKDVEERFSALPNVCIYPKRAHVKKMVDGEWNDLTADFSGRTYPCNVNRSADSVIDALVDLLVLSHSEIVLTSASTFLQTAILLKNARVSV
jgi:glycosyltransferase involved in cell wall biosynthesis